MDGAGQEFFTGPGLSDNQHRRASLCHHLDLLLHALERQALANDLLEIVFCPNFFFEVQFLFGQFVLERVDLAERERVLHRDGHLIGDLGEHIHVIVSKRVVRQSHHTQDTESTVAGDEGDAATGFYAGSPEPFQRGRQIFHITGVT
jgi:hypothetical protein